MRIAFAGTPEFAVPTLRAMISGGYAPLVVLTQPDRPAGRGRGLQASAIKNCALENELALLQPARLSDKDIQAELRSLNLDLMVVVAYGLILPVSVLKIPRYGCWNVHASLLPRWRGAAPIQRAIEAGDPVTGVCIMQMASGLDTGPVFACRETAIGPDETGGTLHDRLASMGADALLECLDDLAGGGIPTPQAQDGQQACYARKLEKAEARINWHLPANEIERRIRAFNPWPVCWTEIGGERLRVWKATCPGVDTTASPGTLVAAGKEGIDMATGEHVLRLQEVQRPGGVRMPVGQYLNAHPLPTAQ